MKFNVLTYGCQMNVHDSDWLIRAMESRGWKAVEESEANIFILNTCSVRDKPEQKVYNVLRRLGYLCTSPGDFVAVGGCVAQQIGEGFLERFPYVRLVFGSDGIVQAPQYLEELAVDHEKRLVLNDFLAQYPEREGGLVNPNEELLPPGIGTIPGQAFVNIMQGCDNFCAYCIVPYTRGRQKSRLSSAIIDECRALVKAGVREITLLGQNVNSFGMDKNGSDLSFAQLLYKIAEIEGLERVRFTTSHPKDIAPEVIKAFGELPNLCPHLHLPVQSGSDNILKKMGRKYDRARYLGIVEGLKEVCPEIALTTDIIVGFPGETDEDFEQTMDIMERVRFESSFSFKYSDRPGVAALKMMPKVPEDVAQKRLTRLQERQKHITRECLEELYGNDMIVLLERNSKWQEEGGVAWRGKDPGGRVVNIFIEGIEGHLPLGGKLVKAKIIEAKNHSLVGVKVGDLW
ncbi:tRNA (N6-isopentenyl adenosine(37)-C2)-methylthiotransferase MiaB [Maridesulfovibrio ferrireducens]|uniref:tRNA (N6-isopentenyl adenosine(37)-C2)-methylthiotransferase MiaB n=1 Tax=Maridesulfovibrio ferrireducens TaxID=246191 RepID=UPI001A24EE9F|nr:tRNA (N6-isopentenyl adenosine(37)-C2)-methylthiotransferase MiaB [Maridesulfovibrio ferrireducens]MBI9110531.1 tRNA (N6-isopentenyl adenosine(37)-C2)-methylthiotransferase MiaB [Maridesulfovibrio ferrireducens]